jgi:hypothetical protein
MSEDIFEGYRKAVASSFTIQQEMHRRWMNGWPVQRPVVKHDVDQGSVKEQVLSYLEKWSRTLAETLEKHREVLHDQYKSGIDAIASAFRTSEAKTPEEYSRLTQEFWRKSIDSYKTALETQSKYLQGLAEMWLDMVTKGRV